MSVRNTVSPARLKGVIVHTAGLQCRTVREQIAAGMWSTIYTTRNMYKVSLHECICARASAKIVNINYNTEKSKLRRASAHSAPSVDVQTDQEALKTTDRAQNPSAQAKLPSRKLHAL